MPGAIAGIFKAPFDILADKLRGYLGLTVDMFTQPAKVMKACQALMPHLAHPLFCCAHPLQHHNLSVSRSNVEARHSGRIPLPPSWHLSWLP